MQASQLNTLQSRLQNSGYKDIHFLIVNSADSIDSDGKLFQEMAELAGQVVTYQEEVSEPVWEKFDVLENNIIVLDRCGRLTYHVLMPWSLLHQPYVKAAILSTYLDNPCGLCRTGKKKLNQKHKHGYRKKTIKTVQHSLHKNEDTSRPETLQPQIYTTTKEEDHVTLSPVVELSDGTIPIRVTYQNPHIHIIDGKEKAYKLVELQTGNSNYHGHPDEKMLEKIIYQGKSETQYKLKKTMKSNIDRTKKNLANKNEKKGIEIYNMNRNTTDEKAEYEQNKNKTTTIKLVIHKKVYGSVTTQEKSVHPSIISPPKQDNEMHQQNYNNKFGNIKINVKKKCKTKKCLQEPEINEELIDFEKKNQFNKSSEEKILETVTTEKFAEILNDNSTAKYTFALNINKEAVKESDSTNSTNDKVLSPLIQSEFVMYPLNINKTPDVSNGFKKSDFNGTILNDNIEIKNETAIKKEGEIIENYKTIFSNNTFPEKIVPNITLTSSTVKSNNEQSDEESRARNKQTESRITKTQNLKKNSNVNTTEQEFRKSNQEIDGRITEVQNLNVSSYVATTEQEIGTNNKGVGSRIIETQNPKNVSSYVVTSEEEFRTNNKEIGSRITEFQNVQNVSSYMNTTVPNSNKQSKQNIKVSNATNYQKEISLENKYLNLTTEHNLQAEFYSEQTSVDDSSEVFIDDNLYNDISQEEMKSDDSKDQNNDKLQEKMAAHYRKLLPWVNYTLSPSV